MNKQSPPTDDIRIGPNLSRNQCLVTQCLANKCLQVNKTSVGLEDSYCSSSDICGARLIRFYTFPGIIETGVTGELYRALLEKGTDSYTLLRWRWMWWRQGCGSLFIAGTQDSMWSVIILVNNTVD